MADTESKPKLEDDLPDTIEAVDHEIEQVRVAIPVAHPKRRPMMWDRIDKLLDRRSLLRTAKDREGLGAS